MHLPKEAIGPYVVNQEEDRGPRTGGPNPRENGRTPRMGAFGFLLLCDRTTNLA
jgi:hypothetical protein